MKQLILQILSGIHYRMPVWVSRVYMPLVYLIRQLGDLWTREYAVYGELKGGQSKLRLGYFGNDERILKYWIQTLFDETPGVEKRSRTAVWKVLSRQRLSDHPYDLLLLELSGHNRRFLSGNLGFLLPRWVDTLLNVSDTLDALSGRKTLKNIEESGYTCRLSGDEEDLRFFYDRMFRPYILSRHQDASVMVDYSYFRKRMKKRDSLLFILVKDGVPQVASFNERKKGRIKFSGLGVLDGSMDIVRSGAIRVLYYFMLSHYKEQGIEVLSFGGTSPLLSDGLTKFKRSMRAVPKNGDLYGEKTLLLIPWNGNQPVGELLKQHPFLHLVDGRLYRALFPDDTVTGSKREFFAWLNQYQFLGIAGTRIYCRTRMDTIIDWINEKSLTGYEVLPFPSREL